MSSETGKAQVWRNIELPISTNCTTCCANIKVTAGGCFVVSGTWRLIPKAGRSNSLKNNEVAFFGAWKRRAVTYVSAIRPPGIVSGGFDYGRACRRRGSEIH
jgi:hypothetical protein